MPFSQEKVSKSDDNSKTIIGTEIELYAPKKEKKPTLAGGWKLMSEHNVNEIISSKIQKIKPQSFYYGESSSKLVIAAVPISFKPPENCSIDTTELEKQLEANEAASWASSFGAQGNSLFTLNERKQNWMCQERQRVNGRKDKFYYHWMADRVFRSKTEVASFILYETYPKKSQKSNMCKSKASNQKEKSNIYINEEMSAPEGFEDGPRHGSLKRKRVPSQILQNKQ